MSDIIWGEFNGVKVTAITEAAYIEVVVGKSEFQVNVWGAGQSSGSQPSYNVIGPGGVERGKLAAEWLLREGLERF
jgi:hypothetical protein